MGAETIAQTISAAQNAARCDRDHIAELREALTLAEAQAIETKRDTVRGAILGEGGRLVAVTFTKRDGTQRTMKVQPDTLLVRMQGEDATDASQRAVATRKAGHPELMPAWDAEAGGVRYINLNTVSRVASGGADRILYLDCVRPRAVDSGPPHGPSTR